MHDLRIVLDDDECVAGGFESAHDVDDAIHVARVQADRRLIEDEQRIDERRAERRREIDSLHFAARQRPGLTVEREIAEPDIEQILETAADLLEYEIARLVEGSGQLKRAQESTAPLDRQHHELVQAHAWQLGKRLIAPFGCNGTEALRRAKRALRVGTRAEPIQQCVGLEARPVARCAWRVGTILRQEHANVHLVRLRLEPREEAPHAIPQTILPRALAFEHPRAMRFAQLAPRHIDRNAALARKLHEIVLALAIRLALPAAHGAFAQRFVRVRHDQTEIDPDRAAEAATRFARPDRRIERKQARYRIAIMNVAIGAVQIR